MAIKAGDKISLLCPYCKKIKEFTVTSERRNIDGCSIATAQSCVQKGNMFMWVRPDGQSVQDAGLPG